MVILDTNMILRYLLNDNKEMADIAEQHILNDDSKITIGVIAEVIYVLSGVYSMKRDEITSIVKNFLDLVFCQEKEILITALDTFGERNLDFVDCVLYGYHKVKNAEIATFDKKLLRIIENN